MSDQARKEQRSAIETVERDLGIFYDELIQTGERSSAINIRKACEVLSKSGCAKITAAAVGRYCAAHFGAPKSQSISNKRHTLAAYVKKWDELHQLVRGTPLRSKRSNRMQFSDPSVAAYVRVLEAERDDANRARDRLLQALRHLEPLQVGDAISMAVPQDEKLRVSKIERDSVRAFIAPDNLSNFGLSYDGKGRILDGYRVLMESPLVHLLRRLADLKPERFIE